jgi:hypothetical protein
MKTLSVEDVLRAVEATGALAQRER